MVIIKTDGLFVVVSKYGVGTDINNLFTSNEDAEKWRTDVKNITLEYQSTYTVISLSDYLSLIREEAYNDGRNDEVDRNTEY